MPLHFPPIDTPNWKHCVMQYLRQHHVDIQRLWRSTPQIPDLQAGIPFTGPLSPVQFSVPSSLSSRSHSSNSSIPSFSPGSGVCYPGYYIGTYCGWLFTGGVWTAYNPSGNPFGCVNPALAPAICQWSPADYPSLYPGYEGQVFLTPCGCPSSSTSSRSSSSSSHSSSVSSTSSGSSGSTGSASSRPLCSSGGDCTYIWEAPDWVYLYGSCTYPCVCVCTPVGVGAFDGQLYNCPNSCFTS